MTLAAVFSKVLNMSLTACVVILFVLLARFFLRRYPKIFSYALWSVVLFRLLCPVSIPSPVSLLGMLNAPAVEAQGNTTTVVYTDRNEVRRFVQQGTPIAQGPSGLENHAAERLPEPEEPAPSAAAKAYSTMDIAGTIWLTGMSILLLYGTGSYFLFRRKLRFACKLEGNIYLADRIYTAFAAGLLFPKIYLPSDLPEHQRHYIIAHEQCHIRRLDHVTRHLAFLALCVHWFNPLVWLAFSLSGKDMEMSCDEAVIRKLGSGIRAEYSASLLTLAMGQRIIPGTPLAFGEGDTNGRIRNMAKWKRPTVWVSTLCLILCVSILVACGVNPEKEVPEPVAVETQPPETTLEKPDQASLNKCAQVLELVQNSKGYQIVTYRWNIGGNVLNDTSMMSYWKHGDNWLHMNRIPQDGYMDGMKALDSIFASICWNGAYYDNFDMSWLDENGGIHWNESTAYDIPEPWLASFQWDDEKVEGLSIENTADSTIVHLAVHAPYEYSEGISTNRYTVDFAFDKDGNFINATMAADFYAEDQGEFGFVNTMQIVSLEADTVAADMEAYFHGEKSAMTIVDLNALTDSPVRLGSETTFTNADGSATFHLMDALPQDTDLKVLTVKPMDLTGTDAQEIAYALFGSDADFYEQSNDVLSKEDFENYLDIWNQYLDEEKLLELYPGYRETDLKDLRGMLQLDIIQYTEAAAEAPKNPYTAYDWDARGDGQIAAMVRSDGIPYTFSVRKYMEGSHMETVITAGIDTWLFSNSRVELVHLCSQLTRTEIPTQEQVQYAADKAQSMLDNMGLGQWQVTTAEISTSRLDTQPREYTITVNAVPLLNGLRTTTARWDPLAGTNYTEATFSFAPDGTLMNFICWSPLEILQEEADPELLDSEALLNRGKAALASYPPIQTFGKSAQYTVNITDISYCMSRAQSSQDEDTYHYVPSLVFRGDLQFAGPEGETLFFLMEEVDDWIVVSALDGSMITGELPE